MVRVEEQPLSNPTRVWHYDTYNNSQISVLFVKYYREDHPHPEDSQGQ